MEIYEILPGYINVHKMHLTHLIVTRGIIHVNQAQCGCCADVMQVQQKTFGEVHPAQS